MAALSSPTPDLDEVRDNTVFEAVMWASSRPGSITSLPESGLLPVALAFVDLETRIFCDDKQFEAQLTLTGAAAVALPEADHIFLSHGLTAPMIKEVAKGTALYPDRGATIVVSASLSDGPRLRLSGPGIEGTRIVSPAISPDVWNERARASYPAGFELIVVDGRNLMVLPRSTHVEVL